jgi:hypothetical protein
MANVWLSAIRLLHFGALIIAPTGWFTQSGSSTSQGAANCAALGVMIPAFLGLQPDVAKLADAVGLDVFAERRVCIEPPA